MQLYCISRWMASNHRNFLAPALSSTETFLVANASRLVSQEWPFISSNSPWRRRTRSSSLWVVLVQPREFYQYLQIPCFSWPSSILFEWGWNLESQPCSQAWEKVRTFVSFWRNCTYSLLRFFRTHQDSWRGSLRSHHSRSRLTSSGLGLRWRSLWFDICTFWILNIIFNYSR